MYDYHSNDYHVSRTVLLIAILLLSVVVGSLGGAVAEAAPSATEEPEIETGTFRGYMDSFAFAMPNSKCGFFSTRDYVTIKIRAYRSFQKGPNEVGMIKGEKTNISIYRYILIENEKHYRKHIMNFSLDDPYTHRIEIERADVGVYHYSAHVRYADGYEKIMGDSVEVRHPAVPYVIKEQDHEGRHIKFIPQGKGNWTLRVQYDINQGGVRTETIEVEEGEIKHIHVDDPRVIVVKVTVTDKYGWVNDGEDGDDYVVVYTEEDYHRLIPYMSGILLIILLLVTIRLRSRTVDRVIKKREGYQW